MDPFEAKLMVSCGADRAFMAWMREVDSIIRDYVKGGVFACRPVPWHTAWRQGARPSTAVSALMGNGHIRDFALPGEDVTEPGT